MAGAVQDGPYDLFFGVSQKNVIHDRNDMEMMNG